MAAGRKTLTVRCICAPTGGDGEAKAGGGAELRQRGSFWIFRNWAQGAEAAKLPPPPGPFAAWEEKILWTDVSGDFGRQRKICFQVSRDFENAPASGENPLPRIVTVPCRWRSPAPESAPLRRRSPPIPTASSFHASSPLFFLFLFPQPPERFLLSSGLTGGTGGDIIKQDTGPQGCPWDREAQRL